MCAHVLVAEDDEKQAEVVRRYLESEGHQVLVVHDGTTALAEARRCAPDLVVLDVMMPGISGFEVCRALRAESGVLVLMLTARSTETDLLLGLDFGADDYVTKPYSPRELMARIRTLLRRTQSAARHTVGAVRVDPLTHTVTVAGRQVECTLAEFGILATLAAEPGRVFSRSHLLERIHGYGRFITERTVDVHVMKLRKKIEDDPHRPARLLTVYGVGYKLIAGPTDAP
ncbi:MAG: response regulator transcription factor [Streptosporangiaceae bacterium]